MLSSNDPKLQGADPPGPEDAPPDALVSADTRRGRRLPPNQARTRKWPVLDTGVHPDPIAPTEWRLTVAGLVEEPRTLTWEDWRALPRVKVFADMHCVTRWSRLGNLWEGVSTRALLERIAPRKEATHVFVTGYDEVRFFRGGSERWSTNLPLAYFLDEDCLLADTHDGEPISLEHGGPVRLVIPRLYAWKSAKWIRQIELRDHDEPGFWERGGYHLLGDPWKEQRFRFSDD